MSLASKAACAPQPDGKKHCCDFVMIPLTAGRMRITALDEHKILEVVPGRAVFCSAPIERAALNDGTTQLSFLDIELKDSAQRIISA
jgi:hypothetical protein